MKEYKNCFSAKFGRTSNCAIMTHTHPRQPRLDPKEQKMLKDTLEEMCQLNIRALAEAALGGFSNKKEANVNVFYSTDRRCASTADLVLGELRSLGIRAKKRPVVWLDAGSEIDRNNLEKICGPDTPLKFSILITHLSVLQNYLGSTWESKNGAIMTSELIIIDGSVQ
jgi:hypothetical protein